MPVVRVVQRQVTRGYLEGYAGMRWSRHDLDAHHRNVEGLAALTRTIKMGVARQLTSIYGSGSYGSSPRRGVNMFDVALATRSTPFKLCAAAFAVILSSFFAATFNAQVAGSCDRKR